MTGEVSPALVAVVSHHLLQHTPSAREKCTGVGSPTRVFYLGITDARANSSNVESNGRGIFLGPLKSRTKEERAVLAAQFSAVGAEITQTLEANEHEAVVIVAASLNGTTYWKVEPIA